MRLVGTALTGKAAFQAAAWPFGRVVARDRRPEIRNNYHEAAGKYPLLAILKAADGLASHVLGT